MRRPTIFLILTVVAAFLAAVVVFSALRTREAQMQKAMAQTVDIVVAAHDLTLGDRLDPGDVKLARWTRESMPEGAFTDPAAVLNSYVRIVIRGRAAYRATQPGQWGKDCRGDALGYSARHARDVGVGR